MFGLEKNLVSFLETLEVDLAYFFGWLGGVGVGECGNKDDPIVGFAIDPRPIILHKSSSLVVYKILQGQGLVPAAASERWP